MSAADTKSEPRARPAVKPDAGARHPVAHPAPGRPALAPLRMCTFDPRPFPPPALAEVPVEYVQEQLRLLAPQFWGKTDTTDCTLVIPIVRPNASPSQLSETARTYGPAGAGRRATEPAVPNCPPLIMKLHVDFLSAHSTLLRALFAGASPIHLIDPARHTIASLPRILSSSSAERPHILLPVPDPYSFRFLAHWCYFRDFRYLRDYLTRGLISWEGVARNVEYLGLPHELRVSLAKLYHLHTTREMNVSEPPSSDEAESGEDCDSATSSDDSSEDEMDVDEEKACPRGRPSARNRFSMCPASPSYSSGF